MRNVRMTICLVVCMCCFDLPKAVAVVHFEDGSTYNVNWDIYESVYVNDSSTGGATTVNFLPGTYIKFTLFIYDHSQVNVSGGSLEDGIYAGGNSQLTITGGSIGWGTYNSGADSWGLYSFGDSQSTISGGTMHGDTHAANNSIITFSGSNFAVDGQPFGYGELTSILGGTVNDYEPTRHLTGTLANGDPIDNHFYVHQDASIILVPEPTTLLLLGLGGLMLRRKR